MLFRSLAQREQDSDRKEADRVLAVLAPVSPVEPTPPREAFIEPFSQHRIEYVLSDSAVEPTPEPPTLQHGFGDHGKHGSGQWTHPTVEPEPCVWREDLSGPVSIYRPTCMDPIVTDVVPRGFTYCCYCGHPLKIDGRTP